MTTYISMDTIVRSVLLRRGYTMHWYLQFLKYGADCLRELSIHTLKTIVNTKKLTVSATGTVTFPADYTGWVRLGLINGQHVVPLVQSKSDFIKIPNLDDTDAEVPWGSASVPVGYTNLYNWCAELNEWGEPIGKRFGYGAGYEIDTFDEHTNRGLFQLHEALAGMEIILDYVGNINSANNLTKIHPYAQGAIEAYIIWQYKENNRAYQMGERKDAERQYTQALARLRSALDPLTVEDIIRIVRRSFTATIKT